MEGIENLGKHTETILKNYTINDLIKRYTQLLVLNEELQKENRELRRQIDNKEGTETISEPLLPDYEEVQDNNGRVWYKRTGNNVQRKESRQIEKYDVIVTKRDLDEPLPSILFVDSFDFESDFAARCFYGKSVYYEKNKEFGRKAYSETWYGNFSPGLNYFSFATYDEIKELFDNINECPSLYEDCINNKEIKERYREYLK